MSATVAKATRRDLRRAVGEEVVQLVEQHEAGLKMHAASLKRHEQAIRVMDGGISDLMGTYRRLDARLGRTFWGRLRWLLRG